MQTYSREPFSGDRTRMGHEKRVLVHEDQILDSTAERSAAKAAYMHAATVVVAHKHSPLVQAIKKICKAQKVIDDKRIVPFPR